MGMVWAEKVGCSVRQKSLPWHNMGMALCGAEQAGYIFPSHSQASSGVLLVVVVQLYHAVRKDACGAGGRADVLLGVWPRRFRLHLDELHSQAPSRQLRAVSPSCCLG